MKFCTKCGNRLNDDDLFCPRCGERQNTPIDAPGQEVSATPEEASREETPVVAETPRDVEAPRAEDLQRVPPREETPVVTETPTPRRRVGIRDFKAKDSIILFTGYTIAFILWLILNVALIRGNSSAIIGKLAFQFATGCILAVMIMRMVHAINIKNKFLMMLQIVFVALMFTYFIACIIIMVS